MLFSVDGRKADRGKAELMKIFRQLSQMDT
jgi:hypothetical protein